eukprot:TRINITY_DN15919_c0_g1_i1.p1 TRINITY_DN15919_c0_g1~~TRINITY_DN15919_c0_g1_i1.p1  ORF type:complete len:466 (-),score=53.15 TRINITY_DN15919_c0_g1_i1:31-1428(-)
MDTVSGSGIFVCVSKPGLRCERVWRPGCPLGAPASRNLDGSNNAIRSIVRRRTKLRRTRVQVWANLAAQGPWSEDTKSISDFLRFCDNGDVGSELQTAIVTYRKPFPWRLIQSQQVDLVSAVHIADKPYFDRLQEELGTYDRVLYEMVADKSSEQKNNRSRRSRWRPPKPGTRKSGFSIIGAIQQGIAYVLDLDFQLECMDYRRENWYHADMDYETFQVLQKERGETFLSFVKDISVASTKAVMSAALPSYLDPFRAKLLWVSRVMPMPLVGLFVIEGVCAPSGSPLKKSPEMKALLNLDVAVAVKVFLAKRISIDMADGTKSLMERSVIIGERNRIAMQELNGALSEGCRKIAVFYGSGHLPDMDQRLREQFGFEPSDVSWRTAWSMKACSRAASPGTLTAALQTLQQASGWPLNRYQTLAIIMLSAFLAVDLWFWEILLGALNEYTDGVLTLIAKLLDKGWIL